MKFKVQTALVLVVSYVKKRCDNAYVLKLSGLCYLHDQSETERTCCFCLKEGS